MAKKQTAGTAAGAAAAAAINTLSVDAGVGGKLTKTWAQIPCRKVYRFPSVPDSVQMKKGHMQIRFGGFYTSKNVDGLSEIDAATMRLAYEKAKAAGLTTPSFSGSGEAYVPVTVTAEGEGGGFVSLDGLTLLTFEVDPTVDLSPKAHGAGVYHGDGHPDTGDGDGDPDEDDDLDDEDDD